MRGGLLLMISGESGKKIEAWLVYLIRDRCIRRPWAGLSQPMKTLLSRKVNHQTRYNKSLASKDPKLQSVK
jgi:hypothetical protein